jgi:hypothetical protein
MIKFNEWLFLMESLGSSIQDFTKKGKIRLFHYSSTYAKFLDLDPKRFGQSSYTQTEKKVLPTPRIFFYLDITEREPFFKGANLYYVDVPIRSIYDVNIDHLGLKGRDIGLMVSNIRKAGYTGIYTIGRGFKCVEWFEPITVKLTTEKQQLKSYFVTSIEDIDEYKKNKTAEEAKEREEKSKREAESWEIERAKQEEEFLASDAETLKLHPERIPPWRLPQVIAWIKKQKKQAR